MKAIDLTDLLGKECVLLEAGRGLIARCLRFYEVETNLRAELELTHSAVFVMNRIRMNGEPAIADWEANSKTVGELIRLSQPRDQVFRSPRSYLHFSSPYGGTRLFFLDEYVAKVRHKDAEGWEWEDLMRKSHEADARLEGRT